MSKSLYSINIDKTGAAKFATINASINGKTYPLNLDDFSIFFDIEKIQKTIANIHENAENIDMNMIKDFKSSAEAIFTKIIGEKYKEIVGDGFYIEKYMTLAGFLTSIINQENEKKIKEAGKPLSSNRLK